MANCLLTINVIIFSTTAQLAAVSSRSKIKPKDCTHYMETSNKYHMSQFQMVKIQAMVSLKNEISKSQ